MTLDPTVPPQGGAAPAPADTPAAPAAPTAEEIRQMVSDEANRLVDARIPGLQSAYERQIAQLRNDLKTAQSDPDGFAGSESSEAEAELARAQREVEALRAGRQYPDVYPLYEAVLNAPSAQEQLQALEDYRKSLVGDQAPASPAQDQQPAGQETSQGQQAPPPVDPNRPLENLPPVPGGGMDAQLADQLIDSIGDRWPDRDFWR